MKTPSEIVGQGYSKESQNIQCIVISLANPTELESKYLYC